MENRTGGGRLRGVLLDFDGTITRPFFDWPAMKREMGFADASVSVLDFLAEAPEEDARRVAEILERHEERAARRAEANEGAAELLAYLRRKSVPHGLVTNNAARHVKTMLGRIGLVFEAVITRDVGFWKPDPRQAIAGAEAIGVPPGECVFIGDGRLDMMAARAAGMTAVLLSPVDGLDCDHRVRRLADAIALLEELLG